MTDLSILIPARNEMFLKNTIEDILAHIEGDTEIIAVLDGKWADPQIPDHPKVTLLYYPESIGQRAATNSAAKLSTAKYLLKCDAHCAFDQGFDVKLMADMQPDWTVVPIMRNLHAFDWVCKNGHRRYQGPSGPCKECGEPTAMDVVWIPKTNPSSTSYCFDAQPHFQYFNEFKSRPEYKGDLTETMSLQGSCWMLTRDKYFELNVCDEEFGSWGSQGIEVAVKTWLSGGRVVVNHKTWYAHMFRTQGGDFSFPYHLSGRQVEHAKNFARDLFFGNHWQKQNRTLSWLVEKFWPVPGWKDEDLTKLKELEKPGLDKIREETTKIVNLVEGIEGINKKVTKGIVYYTDNQLDEAIAKACRNQLLDAAGNIPIVSVSLKPIDFGKNICLPLERGYLTMFKQILAGLEALDCDYVFFCEHDVLYHPTHFEFIPPRKDVYYYNLNVWKVDANTGHALHYDTKQTSGLCADRILLVNHYRKRIENTEKALATLGGMDFVRFIRKQGFEPGSHGRTERVDDYHSEVWQSTYPILDIRHGHNLTPSRWNQNQFRDQRNCRNWIEAKCVDGWYETGQFIEMLKNIGGANGKTI